MKLVFKISENISGDLHHVPVSVLEISTSQNLIIHNLNISEPIIEKKNNANFVRVKGWKFDEPSTDLFKLPVEHVMELAQFLQNSVEPAVGRVYY